MGRDRTGRAWPEAAMGVQSGTSALGRPRIGPPGPAMPGLRSPQIA